MPTVYTAVYANSSNHYNFGLYWQTKLLLKYIVKVFNNKQ